MHFIHESAAPRVVFGRGSVARVSEEVDRIGAQRVLLIGNPGRAGIQLVLAGTLEPHVVGIVARVQGHVPVHVAEEAAEQAASVKGGSCSSRWRWIGHWHRQGRGTAYGPADPGRPHDVQRQ